MNRLTSAIGVVLLSLICAALLAVHVWGEAAVQPNIIFILADDMGHADVGAYGGRIQTPHIDRLAAEGIRFTQAYAGNTICAPSRSALVTGTHMGRTPVRSNTGGVSLRPEDVTIAEVLKSAGYATGGYGKWGLAEAGLPGAPEKKGFDEFFGFYHQIHAHRFYPEYVYRNGKRIDLPGNAGFYDGRFGEGRGIGPVPAVDPDTGRARQFSHYLIVDRMKAFIRAHRDRPFFAYAPWTPPHSRYEIPEDDPAWLRYKDEPWPLAARVHAAFVTMFDRHVGEVMSLVAELGIDDRTIVFFASDNGATLEMTRSPLRSNGSLRGGKTTLYEGGLRVPLVARWPGRIAPGRVTPHLTYFPDVFPTLAELAGVKERVPDVVNGISLVPELLGAKAAGRTQEAHRYLYWEDADIDWKAIRYLHQGTLRQAVRAGDWKGYRPGPGRPLQLYNLATDPGEERDVAAANAPVVERLEGYMKEAHRPAPPQVEPERIGGRQFR